MARYAPDSTGGPSILTVPGLGGSGPSHWQSLWECARPDITRVGLGMWSKPHRNAWITKLDQAISAARAPVVLVAHSLGCLAVAWWAELSAQAYAWPVTGALLVAPPDVDRPGARPEITPFAPAPLNPLPFPSLVVASSNDPWIDLDRAHSLAVAWGSHFVDAGSQGHLNAASGLGRWPDGQELLDRVLAVGGHGGRSTMPPGDARAVLANATVGAYAQPYRPA